MEQWIQTLRGALELEAAIQGPLVPIGTSRPQTKNPPVDTASAKVATAADTALEDVRVVDAATENLRAGSSTSSTPDTMADQDLFGNPVEPAQDASLTPYDRVAALIDADSPLHNMHSLEEVEAYVRETVLIPLDETRLNPVFGVGNPTSDLMVIGEAPGADEDKQGEPFVGRAGQLLTKILAAIQFERSDVYIANILKSRPPDNRTPEPDEVKAHIPILYKQISLIQPKVILCVGRTAGTNLLERKASLASLRGTFHDYHGIPLMVTYHPAALLRNPQWKRPTWEDVQLLRTRYDQLT